MNSKIISSIFLTSIAALSAVSINQDIAHTQARQCSRWGCPIHGPRGKTNPPIIPADVFANSLTAVREGRATDQDYLVLGHEAFNKGQYSEAKLYYSKANALSQDKEVQAAAKSWLGEVNLRVQPIIVQPRLNSP